jgi:hypothetical protein
MQLKLVGRTWGPPVVGLAGTVAAIAIAFARIGNEPQWTTVLMSAGAGVLVGVALMLLIAIHIRR